MPSTIVAESHVRSMAVPLRRVFSFHPCLLLMFVTLSALSLVSCHKTPRPPSERPKLSVPSGVVALPKADVLDGIEGGSGSPHRQPPVSPWRQEESQLFADALRARPADILVIPFEVQDRGFDRIERSLMTNEFAAALYRQSRRHVVNPYLVARALGDGQRRFQWLDVLHLADALKARMLIRGYVGHDGHGHLTLTLTVQQRDSAVGPWNLAPATRSWIAQPFSDEDLPNRVVRRLQPEMLAFVHLAPTSVASASSPAGTGWPWPLPPSPADLVGAHATEPVSAAARFAVLAALAPLNAERTRERLAERGMQLLDETADDSPRCRFLRSYFLHLLHRRPAALAALGDSEIPASAGLRAVLNGNLDRLEASVAQSPPPLEALLLEFELCDLKLEYGGSCEHSKLTEVANVERLSRAWQILLSNRLSNLSSWEVQSNAEIKNLLDEAFPIRNYRLGDLARAAIVVGPGSPDSTPIDLSVVRHVRKILASSEPLPLDVTEFPNRLDYLDLLEGLGESNLLKALTRTGFMQGLTGDALQQLRSYETVYAGHPAFAELHARLLRNILDANPDQPSAALSQEFEQNRFLAAYLEQGQTAISARVLNENGIAFSPLGILADAFVQDFPIRPWWPLTDAAGSDPRARIYRDDRDRNALTLAELAYAEIEVPGFFVEQPFLPPDDLRKLFEQRFRGNPAAAQILAHIATPQSPQADPAAAYREAIQRNPAVWSNYSSLGDWLLQNGDSKGAARAYLSYPGFRHPAHPADVVALSNYAYEAGSALYWRGAFEPARELYQIAAADDDGSYASITSAGRLATLRGDLLTSLKASFEAARRYQGQFSYRDYLCMLHAFGLHQEAWTGFNTLAERFSQPEVWVSAFVGQRMAGTTPEQLRQWLLSDSIRSAHFLGRSYSADYALLWYSIDREPPADLPQLLDQLQGPSKATVDADGLATSRPSWTQEGAFDLVPPSEFRRVARQRAAVGSQVPAERTMFANAYVDLRAGRYADAVRKFDGLAAHYSLEMSDERYVLPYFAYASAKAGDPLHLEQYLDSARVGGDFAASLAKAFFLGLHGHKSDTLEYLKAAFYHRPFENTGPIFSEYRYAEACEWLFNDTHEDAYRQLALEWARMQQRVRPEISWIYALEARLSSPGPERTQALAMTLYLDPGARVVASLSAREKSRLADWLTKNNPFTHQGPRRRAPTRVTLTQQRRSSVG